MLLNTPPSLLSDTLTIKIFIVSGNFSEAYPLRVINLLIGCIMVLFISVSSVLSILTFILLGYSSLHKEQTYCKRTKKLIYNYFKCLTIQSFFYMGDFRPLMHNGVLFSSQQKLL